MARNALTLEEWNLLMICLDVAQKDAKTRMVEIGDSKNDEFKSMFQREGKIGLLRDKINRMDLG